MKYIITIYLLLFPFTSISYSQTKSLLIEQLSVRDGLFSSNTWSVAQDSSGFIWIGMDKGIARYDGYEIINYSSSKVEDNGLIGEDMTSLYVDDDNQLWAGSRGRGIFKLNKETNRFEQINLTDSISGYYNSNRVTDLIEDSDGNIWATTFNGLIRIDKNSGKVERFLTNENEEIIYRSSFVTIDKDKFGCFWFTDGFDEGQLICFDPQRKKLVRRLSLPDSVSYGTSVYIKGDKLFVGTTIGYLIDYDIVSFGNVEMNSFKWIGNYNDGILAILKTDRDKLLLGSARNLLEYEISSQKFVKPNLNSESELLPYQTSIEDIIQDSEGNIWFTTDEDGIGKIGVYKNPFQHLNVWPENSLKRNKVYGLEIDNNNNLWIGTTNGMVKYNQANKSYRYFEYNPQNKNGLSNSFVSAIQYSSDNKLYIGTIGGGLNVYDPHSETFTHYQSNITGSASLYWDYIRSLFESRDNSIWIGSFGGSLESFNRTDESFTYYHVDFDDTNSINARRVLDFAEDKNGNIWLASMMNGVDYFDRDTGIFRHIKHNPNDSNSISSDNTTSLYLEGDSVLWVGTNANGLNKYNIDQNKFYNYTSQDGLASNSISSIVRDKKGQLWLSTGSGISVFEPDKNSFRNFNIVDGLQNSEFTPASYTVDDDGFIYFGGDNGVTKFHPDSVTSIKTNVKPVITKLNVIDRRENIDKRYPFMSKFFLDDEIKLSSADYFFSIEFSALSYIQQNKIRYAYKLEGFQENWISTDYTNRIATFTNLAPGDYIFRLALLNEDGSISENQIEKSIIILPMFYQTVWFHILLVLFVIGFIYWLYRIRINKILELEKLRLKIASDLHDEVGSTLTKVSMRAQMLEMQINGEKESKNLKRISEQAREAVSTMHDIVWAIDSRNDEAESLFNKMKDTAFSILADKNVKVDFNAVGLDKDEKLTLNFRQNVYLVMKEAVHNITKHSNAKNIKITLNNSSTKFEMVIYDDGNRFVQNEYSSGQGLKNMQMRAEKIGGRVIYKNENGFSVILTAPPIK